MKKTDDVSGTHLWLVLMKAHRALQRLATRSIESSEVGLSDFAVLEMLLHKGPQPVNEIGRRIELTSGAITTAVDRLESRDLVTREAHPSERRARIVRTTCARRYLPEDARVIRFVNADLIASGLSLLRPELAAIAAARMVLREIDRLAAGGNPSWCARAAI